MTSTSGSAINARDFGQPTTDPNRDEWQAGPMIHLVEALQGRPVTIVLDKRTGYTQVNVILGGVRQTPGYGTFQVLVQSVHEDGTTGRCWHRLPDVGTVIEMGFHRGRWDAMDSYRNERSAAIRKLQDEMVENLGLKDRYELPRGKWDARIFPGDVHASFTPEKCGDPVKFTWKPYSRKDLAAAS